MRTKEEDNKSRLALTLLKQLLHDVLIVIGRLHFLRYVCSGILQVFCKARRGQMIRPNCVRLQDVTCSTGEVGGQTSQVSIKLL